MGISSGSPLEGNRGSLARTNACRRDAEPDLGAGGVRHAASLQTLTFSYSIKIGGTLHSASWSQQMCHIVRNVTLDLR
ncbi:Uncharacterised protein [Pandoraea pnomenusa]|uniref:Uncharacterized protein n=1 Tax=Pandoraea pnomenusa TaxID=93220 RepID=A0A378YLQ4_9BURK|nr:Uncharacterised protein [Pandoraea pnomenusa]